jgi:excisionase family DNA binding protein
MNLLTIEEASKLSRMSQGWWRQRIFRREIKFLKIGRSIRIPLETVEEILEKASVEPKKGVAER